MSNVSGASGSAAAAAAAANAAANTAAAASTSKTAADKDTFLKLMVAQLKYQDPMKPADGAEFLAQTAQFTMVEKIEELANQMTVMATSERQGSASGMIGRWIEGTDSAGTAVEGNVTGVRLENTGPVLMVGDREVALTSVKEVHLTKPES